MKTDKQLRIQYTAYAHRLYYVLEIYITLYIFTRTFSSNMYLHMRRGLDNYAAPSYVIVCKQRTYKFI